MLTADYLASLSDELVELFGEVESEILRSIINRVQKTEALTPSSVFQLEKLQDLGALTKEVTRMLADALNVSIQEVKRLMQEAGVTALAVDDAIYAAAGLSPAPIARSMALKEVIHAGVLKTNGMLRNFTGTTASTVRVAYSNLLDRAYIEVATDAFSFDEAIRRAVTRLAREGVTSVAYPSGRAESIEASVRKCITTGVNQTVGGLQLARASEMDSDLVEVTSHAGARPEHAVWQGGIYSISGKNPNYASFYTATGYGSGEGLCGWNCYHSFYPYFEGLSLPSFDDDPAKLLGKTNDQVYEESQKQREYERRVRKSKSQCFALDTAIKNAKSGEEMAFYTREFQKAAVLLKNREEALRGYVRSTGRALDAPRTAVGGFGRSMSGKAVWANRKASGR